ncbi:MAG: diiron oxygenase [Hydrogenophilales bacterium]|nr:diiron oxygenase [Hydrogenophilales bacterium]
MPNADLPLLKQLSFNSEPYHDPLTRLNWDELNLNDYWLPPAALSLAGLPEFEQQDEQVKRRLSQYEFVNFIQAGLWLEGLFVERLSKALKHTESLVEYAYRLHEIREEAGHSLMFLKLMEKSGLHLPANSFQRPWLADFLGRHAPMHSRLFCLAVVIGEEVPDRLNRYVRANGDAVNPLIKQMCRLHIIDEARHIARARGELERGLKHSAPLARKLLSPWVRTLIAQFVRAFYLPRAEVYELAGLTPGHQWRALAHKNPTHIEFITQSIHPTLNLLTRHGLLVMPRI